MYTHAVPQTITDPSKLLVKSDVEVSKLLLYLSIECCLSLFSSQENVQKKEPSNELYCMKDCCIVHMFGWPQGR